MATSDTSGRGVVVIRSPSPRAELLAVVRAGMAVCFGVWLYLASVQGAPESASDGAAARQNLLPFQSIALDLDPVDQRAFRELQVALIEAQNIRSTTGTWPDVPQLAELGIPPFAPDATWRGAEYDWHLQRDGYFVAYRGIPSQGAASTWLGLIQEPNPDIPPEPYRNDEEHARLLDGTILHVSIWRRTDAPQRRDALVRIPQAEGWTQVFAIGRSASH